MIHSNFKDFPRTGRILGIDWGVRRVGVAISDATHEFVFTRPVISYDGDCAKLVKIIVDLASDENIVGIVIGLPLRTDGTESETTKQVIAFAENLQSEITVPIAFIDETLTSSTAQQEMGRVRVSDIKENLDSLSARVILENAISLIARS